ncbi:MAG TPA: hypothetical protein ENI86_02255 [Acidimicrobiales bacterium]|nr:hypothetical protein [Acidimicrobiales bacterium]
MTGDRTPPSPREVALSYLEALNVGDVDLIASHVSEDFHNEHTSARGTSLVGRDTYRERLPSFLESFEDLRYEAEDVIAEGCRVAVPYVLTARVSGHPVRIRGMFRFRIEDGLITHRVDYWDGEEFRHQIEDRS